ncbi:hypothetical protein Baya_6559 [Bagarius yarrelli]|uniref:Uncharacterized protein n=1 Tax=Bagarius yarrelli TaxID=175774 RepID=A0A556U0K1_BAGYA|nr:hypothetical protein Baya_6559 [Bagarius yarrelli]
MESVNRRSLKSHLFDIEALSETRKAEKYETHHGLWRKRRRRKGVFEVNGRNRKRVKSGS